MVVLNGLYSVVQRDRYSCRARDTSVELRMGAAADPQSAICTLAAAIPTIMEIQWNKEVDAALSRAKDDGKPLLLDFSAAPM
jgi:hypothetical protein